MSHKAITAMIATVTSVLAMGVLAGCPPNAYHVLTLTVTPIDGGTITTDPDLATYFAGTEVTLEAVPNDGYKFHRWVGTGINTTVNPTRKRIYSDDTIVAEFTLVTDVIEGEGESAGEGEGEGDIVKDGGFESDSGDWSQVSLTSMDIVCDYDTCGELDGLTSMSGSHWAWFGNDPSFNYESAFIFQEVTLPAADEVYLRFNMAIPRSDMPFTFRILFDGQIIDEFTETDDLLYGNYQPVNLDISDYADGRTTVLTFSYNSTGILGDTSALFLDDISIE